MHYLTCKVKTATKLILTENTSRLVKLTYNQSIFFLYRNTKQIEQVIILKEEKKIMFVAPENLHMIRSHG